MRARTVFLLLGVALVGVCVLSILVGRTSLEEPGLRDTLLVLRAQRTVVALIAGGALAVGGVLVQGLFRNPLASPSVLGTTAGATLGGQLALLVHQALLAGRLPEWMVPEMVLPVGCLLGAALALATLLVITQGRGDMIVVLLGGFILSSFFLSLGSFVMSLGQESFEVGRAIVAFTLGGVDAKGLRHIALALPLVVAGTGAAWLWARPLDLLLSGEEEALSLGVPVRAVRRWCIIWTAILTAAAVAIGGNVGFVGLVVPHALRPFLGARHARLVPAALLAGGAFLVACDVIARAVPTRSPMPLGVVTGLVGAPVFLALLVRASREGRL